MFVMLLSFSFAIMSREHSTVFIPSRQAVQKTVISNEIGAFDAFMFACNIETDRKKDIQIASVGIPVVVTDKVIVKTEQMREKAEHPFEVPLEPVCQNNKR